MAQDKSRIQESSSRIFGVRFVCDNSRHLICVPYSVSTLHEMAEALGIKRCWFHNSTYPHYDIPKRRIQEIQSKCEVVTAREVLEIIKAAQVDTTNDS